ncbi:MAG: SRPBCC domain-containing protein [Chloroflexi bacterium]|nr:SRPBCC domain-containing protein [Chloroflexota bacterium]
MQSPLEPIRLAFEVACAAEQAFQTWTERIGAWWPKDHTVTCDPNLHVVIEPWVGGRIFERTPSGVEHAWGEVTTWEPPRRFGYRWHLRRDRSDATDVDIRFVALGASATRVEIEHRGWERLGCEGEVWRGRNFGGWSALLPHFVHAANLGASSRNAARQIGESDGVPGT